MLLIIVIINISLLFIINDNKFVIIRFYIKYYITLFINYFIQSYFGKKLGYI